MKLIRSDPFMDDFRKLPPEVRQQARRKLGYLVENMGHPSLRVKRLRRDKRLYEGSVNMDYRFVFEVVGEAIVLHRIGGHDILDKH